MHANPHTEHMQELLEDLNEPQREAVTHGEGPLLILAGAGSGKTRVLAHRIAYLIYNDQAHPSEILAITFTNKAASEMRTRVEGLLGHATRGMWLLTFHSACARILRSHADRLGYTRQFTIYDQADARRLIKHCLSELSIDPKRFTPAGIHHQISEAKNRLRRVDDYRAQVGSSYYEQIAAEVYELYQQELMRSNAMDFDDLLLGVVNLLEAFPEVRERYSETFGHVLVDEYQDTNHAQYRLLQLLIGGGQEQSSNGRPHASGHRNLVVVGDDSQSIYGFRCADIRNILDFQEDFPDARVIKLEQNYRSTQTILSAANSVIANNRGGMAKRLWSELGKGEPIRIRELDDEHTEARFIVGEIQRLVEEEELSRREIAVFYRTNAMSRVLEDALVRAEIPYQVIGGTKFYERAEIKDAIAYLSLLSNPQDIVSFSRIANSPRRGLGQTSLARVINHAQSVDVPVWDAAESPEQIPGLGSAAVKSLRRFMDTMGELRELRDRAVPVGDVLEALLAKSGYIEALEAERSFEAQGRIENLQELVEVAREFDARAESGEDTLDVFLAQIALVADADSRREEDGLVTLMTLHNAKGLEYPVVFIVGCEDGVFPHSRSLEEGGLEEERRLFYVGVTRAMRQLHLSYARRRAVFGAQAYGLRSRFLDEIPRELTDSPERVAVGSGVGVTAGAFPSNGTHNGLWQAASVHTEVSNDFRLGEDIVHAAFGDGVVTALEPDGIIVVRFARDGRERKLMAEHAPVSHR